MGLQGTANVVDDIIERQISYALTINEYKNSKSSYDILYTWKAILHFYSISKDSSPNDNWGYT